MIWVNYFNIRSSKISPDLENESVGLVPCKEGYKKEKKRKL